MIEIDEEKTCKNEQKKIHTHRPKWEPFSRLRLMILPIQYTHIQTHTLRKKTTRRNLSA